MAVVLDLADIQGNILSAYGKQGFPKGRFITLHVDDPVGARKFVNALLGAGVRVHRASAEFEVAGRSYPRGSYVVKCSQSFRAHVLDMFEPQDHPNDFPYPGGPPNRPYDTTGWTLAFQMGVHFDRYTEPVTGPFSGCGAGPGGLGCRLTGKTPTDASLRRCLTGGPAAALAFRAF